MTKKAKAPDTVTIAKITVIGTIAVAVISLLGNLVLGYWQLILKPSETNQPTPAPESNSLAIEEIPLTVYTFEGDDNSSCCVGQANLELTFDVDHLLWYALNYTLPANDSRHGYAGFAFIFSQSQNLSEYNAIEFTINFGDETNEADVNFEDITKTTVPYHIVGNGLREINVVVPINNFSEINLTAVRSIGFQVDSKYTSGSHKLVVGNVRLTAK